MDQFLGSIPVALARFCENCVRAVEGSETVNAAELPIPEVGVNRIVEV